jgi:hypothetical protein
VNYKPQNAWRGPLCVVTLSPTEGYSSGDHQRRDKGITMLDAIRFFISASHAVALMVFAGIVAGFMTAIITSDTQRCLQIALGMFALTGAALTTRLWRASRVTGLPPVDPTT